MTLLRSRTVPVLLLVCAVALALVATLAPTADAAMRKRKRAVTWAPAATATITPGVQMYTDGGQCTANFVFTDRNGGVYVGYAAHCAGLGAATDTNGCGQASVPIGTPVTFERGGSLLTSGTVLGRGTLAYSSWETMNRIGTRDPVVCSFNDFALVKVAGSDVSKVNPSIPFWGGPTGIDTDGLGAGESDFASHFEDAARKAPGDPNILIAHIAALGAAGEPLSARERATAARAAFPGIEQFALLEAVYASAVGDDERAERATAALSTDSLDRALHEARHALRRADWAGAEAALARAREFAPFDVSAWALTGLLWRVTDPEKAAWLHEQEGLVQLLPLADSEEVMPPAIALLGRLHDTSAFPLGQSLRGGTQTRGILFDRTEPALADLKRAILSTVGTYRESLPERDASHPLLRHCSGEWRLNGSWSVRLRSGGDHHAPHIHPQGILSSALYLMLPPPDEDGSQGTLELGRPAPDLRLDLPPLHRIAPKEGHLALFPSTLYHGTTAFGSGMRMTTAFDVIARGGLGDGTDDDGSRLE